MGPGKGSVVLASISCVLSWIGATWAGVTSVLTAVNEAADVCGNIKRQVNPEVVTCQARPDVDTTPDVAPALAGVLASFIFGAIAGDILWRLEFGPTQTQRLLWLGLLDGRTID